MLVSKYLQLILYNLDNRNFWDGEEVKLFRSIVQILLSNTNDQSSQIERFQEYMEYHDVKQHVIQGMAKIVHSCGKKNLNSSHNELNDFFTFSCS